MQSWELVRVFLALHRAQSYEGASQILGIDISTVRRKIQSLESSLGFTLFTRDANGVVLVAEHEPLLHSALKMEAAANRFQQHSELAGSFGLVRMTMLDIFAAQIAGGVEEFQRKNPGIILEITTESRFLDLEKENVDLAVRLARPIRGTGGIRKLADVPFQRYASRSFLEKNSHKRLQEVSTLSLASDFWHRDHEFVLADERDDLEAMLDRNVVCRVDSYGLLKNLCEEGLGVALLPKFLAETSSNLLPFDQEETVSELWLVFRRETSRAQRIQETIKFLVSMFKDK
jgi:DNA-binding transcriptional LysR family regulator